MHTSALIIIIIIIKPLMLDLKSHERVKGLENSGEWMLMSRRPKRVVERDDTEATSR